jgi:putative flippase GtrA
MKMLRSLSVSLITSGLEIALFFLSTVLLAGGTALLAARWICGSLGAVMNFTLNRLWAFQTAGGSVQGQAARYAVTAISAVTLATVVFGIFYAVTGLDPRILHLFSMAVVWTGFTFPMLRHWVFGAKSS